MRILDGFVLRPFVQEYIVTGDSPDRVDFSKVVSLNETAAWLWNQVQGRDFNADELVALLTEHYDVSEQNARADVLRLLDQWKHAGLTEE